MADASVVIPFEGGLDMVTPVQTSSSGTLVNCLNYEVGPIKGYKRIDGFERFDNFPGGGASNLYRAFLTVDGPAVSTGMYIYSSHGALLGVVAAVLSEITGECLYVPARPGACLMPGVEYIVALPGATGNSASVVAVAEDFRDVATTPEQYLATINAASATLRGMVSVAPRPVAGVHHGRSAAYAAVDCLEVDVSVVEEEVLPGTMLAYNNTVYIVLRVDNGVAQLHPSRRPIVTPTSDVYAVTVQDVTNGEATTIMDGAVPTTTSSYEGSYSAGIFKLANSASVDHLMRGYIPVPPTLAIAYSAAGEEFGSTVTLSNGTNTVEYEVQGFSVYSGDFDSSTAVGVLNLGMLLEASGTWNGVIDDSYKIDGATDITGVVFPDLAGTGRLRGKEGAGETHTHYQWGTYNFLGTVGHEMSFCVTGKSRAVYIGSKGGNDYWGNVVANEDATLDIPKYISFHAGQRLVLGNASGSSMLSAVGDPLNFSGMDGAVEIGNGDNITGLLEASDSSTILFGSKSIRRIVGAGADLELRTISPEGGAFDYTAATVAGMPMYVNQNGVCSLEQTSAYGDFKNSSISGSVDPWLTPRVVQDSSSFELGGTVCAFPVRDKNQYRLFLGDGSVLNMSMTSQGPQPTISNYALEEGSLRVPLAWSSSVSDKGEEYVLVVWDRAKALDGVRGLVEDPPADNTVYRLDHGWGFDGVTFPHYIETAYMYQEDPAFLSITMAVLYGMGYGSSELKLRASGIEDDFDQPFNDTVQEISMPRNRQILYKTIGRVMGIVDHANWGRGIKLRIENITPAGHNESEPSHILQSVRLFVQTEGVSE